MSIVLKMDFCFLGNRRKTAILPLTEPRNSFHLWLRQRKPNEAGLNVAIITMQVTTAERIKDLSIGQPWKKRAERL